MGEVTMVKVPGGLAPADAEAEELMKKIKQGRPVRCKIVRIRSWEFHKKFFVLANFAFDLWTETMPARKHEMKFGGRVIEMDVQPNFERFRKDLVILAGYFEATFNIKGDVRVEAKSISFDSMDQDEFEAIYSSCIDVILSKILTHHGLDEAKVRAAVDRVLQFDSGR